MEHPLTRCPEPGCSTLVKRGRCPEHRTAARKPLAQRLSSVRLVMSGGEWEGIRARQLAAHPDCATCGQPATEVDHIRPISEGGDPRHPDNLQSLCTPHHQHKTATERQRRDSRRRASTKRTDQAADPVSESQIEAWLR